MPRSTCWPSHDRLAAAGRRCCPDRCRRAGRLRHDASAACVRGRRLRPAAAVPGHVPRYRRRHLGRSGHGRKRRPPRQLLAAVRTPGRRLALEPRDAAGPSLIAGFRPSQDLTFSPLSATSDNGRAWSSDSPLDAPLASAADALAAAPASENLLALLSDGTAMLAAPAYTSWKTLTTLRALAGTPAGRHCGLHALTAVAYTPSGLPLMAGTCARPGNAGIFADRDGVWQA